MKNTKNGFTLMEILMVLVLTGVIISIFMTVVQPFKPKYKTLYYAAIQILSKVDRELAAGSLSKRVDLADAAYCQYWLDTVNTINSETTVGCGTFYTATKASPYGNITAEVSKPNIVLSNSMKIYFSARQMAAVGVYYRIVTVDINGKGRPGQLGEDYVSFLVTDDGSILPLGTAADDGTHVAASISIYSEDSNGGRTFVSFLEDSGKKFMPYRKAYCLSGLSVDAYTDYCNGYTVSPSCGSGKVCMLDLQKELVDIKF